ncbi:Hypothetical protein P9211_08141 [Prochlorococcus marinus str. MIT 9211]|uniref:Uncharacterized protein n=1 Tax=Prochlorococcus marinus (strain MIT 9211) TaxID=93059 RepID=A9BA83_PROM4|nr:Hypothetical protein P9211_08141 [Prochlorococcus marinus str. MIT 9211]
MGINVAFTPLVNSQALFIQDHQLISHNVHPDKSKDVPSRFDNESYGHTRTTVPSQTSQYQLRELFGLGTGRQFSGFGFPDATSNWDAESIHILYEEVMDRQILDRPIQTNDIRSPFQSSIGD